LYILKYLPKNKNIKIFDAGCGNGKYAEKLMHFGYKKIYGLDIFPKLNNIHFNYIMGSLDHLPYNNSSFDFVYYNSAIYYLNNINKGFFEFSRVLKKGDKLLITVPTKYSLFTLWRRFKLWLGLKSAKHLKGLKFYSRREYINFLEKNDFEVILVDGYDLSFLFYPAYRKFSRFCELYLGFKIPLLKNRITKSKFMRDIKSIFGYHMIIVGKKK